MRSALLLLFLLSGCLYLNGQAGRKEPLSSIRQEGKTDTANARIPNNSASADGYITFANAFRWNHAGPTGGYWSDNSVNDFTFRPVCSEIASYKLEIYNRNGYLVFGSSELYKGWDGYLENGTLAPQGVYIWKASGKYGDGNAFRKAGDVTFIY